MYSSYSDADRAFPLSSFLFFSNCQLSASNHKMLPAVWLKHKKASQCSSHRRTRSDNRDERLTDGPCLIFIVNRFLTTCLECGKEIYGLVLKQAAMEGLGKEKKTENAKREQADWTARKLLTLVLWKPISKIMRKNKLRNKLYLSSCLTNNIRILSKEINKMKREHFWFRDTEFSFDWSENVFQWDPQLHCASICAVQWELFLLTYEGELGVNKEN